MQRNKVLAKEILELIVRGDVGGGGLYGREILNIFADKYQHQLPAGLEVAVSYHLQLLASAGFLKSAKSEHDEENFEMTWAGHDFIEAD